MEKSKNPSVDAATEEKAKENQELILCQLRKEKGDGFYFYEYQGFWCPEPAINAVISFQKHFQAQESDVILATYPKSGTTWLKALTFTIMNRSRFELQNSPLHTTTLHQLVPFLEFDLYLNHQSPTLECFSAPRIFATHVPHALLPGSVLNSSCRIVYVCRNPLDQFISEWLFIARTQDKEPSDLAEAFERACNGIQIFGPIWEHTLGYWKASIEQPDKIFFLKYEDLKEDIASCINRLADFLGCPLSEEEVTQGVVEEISKLCSFDYIQNLEVTKTGRAYANGVKNSHYLRKGEVGDWKNYLTPSMSERLQKITEEKLAGSGLTFKTSLQEPELI